MMNIANTIYKKKKKPENQIDTLIHCLSSNCGVISIFLCLIFAVMISIVLIMIEGARVNAIKAQLECAVDMGMDSVLAEYHRELFERYSVLFVDSSYGAMYGSLDNVADRFREYANYNLNPEKNLLPLYGSRDLLGLDIDSVDILFESRATDNNGEVFKYMANSYMLERFGIGYIDDARSLIEVSDSNRLLEGDIMAENDRAQNRVNSVRLPKRKNEKGQWVEVSRDNPTVAIDSLRRRGILSVVCDEPVSGKTVELESLVSNRSLVKGKGLNPDWEKRNSLETELLFNEYILLKCGNYTNILDNSLLNYQVEYVIEGNNNDTENLKAVVTKLLLMRGTANSIYFANHPRLKEQASILAQGLSIITMMPDLKDTYQAAITASWIFAESAYDVKALLKGKRIPFLKGDFDWNLDLDRALLMTSQYAAGIEVSTNSNNNGQTYGDYLRVLLYATPAEKRTLRCMDIVEMDIRNITGKSSFSLDDCIAALEFQIMGTSSYGYNYIANRKCSYW